MTLATMYPFLFLYFFVFSVNAQVEHVISHVILSLTDDLGSTSVDDFILKVHGYSEYFLK